MAYFTLCTRYEGNWHPQFGDHDREVVEQERRDILNSPDPAEHILVRDTRIVKTPTAHQWAVDRAVAALNRSYTATERYLRIVRWARRRYAERTPDNRIIKRDRLVISTGGVPSPYARIEDAAAYRYLGCERRYPGYGSVSR